MKTTNLFVELVIIGVSAFSWVLLLVLWLFGHQWVPLDQAFSPTALIPLISIIYLLGIVTDRFADRLFARKSSELKKKYFSDDGQGTYLEHYHNARREILLRSARLSELIEYSRSRMRICRGWVFNLPFIMVFANLYIWTNEDLSQTPRRLVLSALVTFFSLLLAWGAYSTWKQLNESGFRKIASQAAYLVEHDLKD